MARQEIRLSAPYLTKSPLGQRLCCKVTVKGKTETAWFEVSEAYAPYLTEERLDAFVEAFLPLAMRENADIICEAPVSRRLLYQINHYLLPTVSRNIEMYHPVTVKAKPADGKLASAGAVATGWTGGVDSMFTLKNMLAPQEPGKKLTHLLIANNGALESKCNEEVLHRLVNRAENGISGDTGLKIVGVNSNLQVLLHEPYLAVSDFRLPAVVLALQKLFSVFFNSSTYEYGRFCFVGENSSYYEMFLLPALSTQNTTFYSAGGSVPRIEKLRQLSADPLAQKYLHPCIYALRENCGRCGKCIRTETALYALGTLERFEKVFDVPAFEKNKDWYMAKIIALKNSQHYAEAYQLLRQKGLITKRAEEMAGALRAAQEVVKKNKEILIKKFK